MDMDLFSIIRLGLLLASILVLLTFVTMKKEVKTNKSSLSYYGVNLLKALLFSQVIAIVIALVMGGDPETFIIVSGYGISMGFIGYTSIYLGNRISDRKELSFFYQQIIEFFATLFGICIGATVGSAVLSSFRNDVEPIWNLDGLDGIFNTILIAGIVLAALLVASTRVFYNFKLFEEQQVSAQRELDVLRLQEQATSAQLQVLQTRINPHFLYNALNAIASLVHEDPDKAEQMTMALSRLFRSSLDSNTSHSSTVEKEVALVHTYLEIEEIRFGDRLSTSVSIDPKAMNEKIPRFLLQPLVENAIKHGVANQDGEGFVGIEIIKKEDTLEIVIKDSGPDFPIQMTGGYGWKSVSDSLELLYPERHELYLANNPEKHVHISLRNEA